MIIDKLFYKAVYYIPEQEIFFLLFEPPQAIELQKKC